MEFVVQFFCASLNIMQIYDHIETTYNFGANNGILKTLIEFQRIEVTEKKMRTVQNMVLIYFEKIYETAKKWNGAL